MGSSSNSSCLLTCSLSSSSPETDSNGSFTYNLLLIINSRSKTSLTKSESRSSTSIVKRNGRHENCKISPNINENPIVGCSDVPLQNLWANSSHRSKLVDGIMHEIPSG